MSLIGSLDDLGLGDILQIINLSQKSGVLVVMGDQGEGRILFRDGLVRGASQKGRPHRLRDLLVQANLISADAYDEVVAANDADGQKVLIERELVAEERLISVCREAVESAVVEMFSWRSGEFSFDVRCEIQPGDPDLLLAAGVNAQYFAMEGARLQDEMSRSGGSPDGDSSDDAEATLDRQLLDSELAAFDVLAERVVDGVTANEAGELEADPLGESDAGEPGDAADTYPSDSTPIDGQAPVLAAALVDADVADDALRAPLHDPLVDDVDEAEIDVAASRPPLVVIDPDLRVLEWTKRVLKSEFPRVHIFQQSSLGLLRIRQYLSRAELPLVLISPESVGEPAAGIKDVLDFVERLKRQAPRMPVMWLSESLPSSTGASDGCVSRPGIDLLRHARATNERDGLGETMRRELLEGLSRCRGDGAQPVGGPDTASMLTLKRLREATEDLSAASARGEVLPRVIDFARESFGRVAMFLVCEGRVLGMAESGLQQAGGPDADAFREIDLAIGDSRWFEEVIRGRVSVRSAPGESDGPLCDLLCGPGGMRPLEAYLAPIESSDQIVALLYADQLPEQREIGDTSALEVVLSHAGLALDRAVLERALYADHDAGASNLGSTDLPDLPELSNLSD